MKHQDRSNRIVRYLSILLATAAVALGSVNMLAHTCKALAANANVEGHV